MTRRTDVLRRRTAIAAAAAAGLALALGVGVPAAAQAGVVSYGSGVLTYTGANEENSVGIAHPGADSGSPADSGNPPVMNKLLIRENASGEDVTIGPSAAAVCEPDSFYGVQCDVPIRFVANLGGSDDEIEIGTDEVPVVVEIHADGGAGQDVLGGGAGRNVFRGGPDSDRLSGHGGDDLLWGDDGDDTLVGGEGSDQLHGLLGADRLTGEAGNDGVHGGDGDDQLDYSPVYAFDGSDTYDGGTGHDRFGYFGRTDSVTITLDGRPNDGQSGENDNIGPGIEEVDGSDVADVMIGSAGPDGLAGRGATTRSPAVGATTSSTATATTTGSMAATATTGSTAVATTTGSSAVAASTRWLPTARVPTRRCAASTTSSRRVTGSRTPSSSAR